MIRLSLLDLSEVYLQCLKLLYINNFPSSIDSFFNKLS